MRDFVRSLCVRMYHVDRLIAASNAEWEENFLDIPRMIARKRLNRVLFALYESYRSAFDAVLDHGTDADDWWPVDLQAEVFAELARALPRGYHRSIFASALDREAR